MPGIFITRGMTVSIPAFSMRIDNDGNVQGPPLTLHVRFDVCPSWVQVAKRHLDAATTAKTARDIAWRGNDNTAKSLAVEAEFEASMQAVMAAAIAWDAVYAIIKQHVDIPDPMLKKWRQGRTARYVQVTETLRRAFGLRAKGVALLRGNLKKIYSLRDMAVHPSGKIGAALNHPELDVGMEWRFVYFRSSNAQSIVNGTVLMLWDLAHNAKPKDSKLSEYLAALAARLKEIYPAGPPSIQPETRESDA